VRVKAHAQHSALIDRTLTYIDSNLSGDLSLHTLAGLLQITPSYLSTLFHRETGQTIACHINHKRLNAACHLLANTRLQVQTVAQLSGFADPNYFSKRFKQKYGVTPAQYRLQQSALLHEV
jgi:two-component system response regulator YesN